MTEISGCYKCLSCEAIFDDPYYDLNYLGDVLGTSEYEVIKRCPYCNSVRVLWQEKENKK